MQGRGVRKPGTTPECSGIEPGNHRRDLVRGYGSSRAAVERATARHLGDREQKVKDEEGLSGLKASPWKVIAPRRDGFGRQQQLWLIYCNS